MGIAYSFSPNGMNSSKVQRTVNGEMFTRDTVGGLFKQMLYHQAGTHTHTLDAGLAERSHKAELVGSTYRRRRLIAYTFDLRWDLALGRRLLVLQ